MDRRSGWESREDERHSFIRQTFTSPTWARWRGERIHKLYSSGARRGKGEERQEMRLNCDLERKSELREWGVGELNLDESSQLCTGL